MKKKVTPIFVCFAIIIVVLYSCNDNKETTNTTYNQTKKDSVIVEEDLWVVPDTSTIPHDEFGDMVR